MTGIFRFREVQPVIWFRRSKAQSNQHCLYCGVHVGVGSEIDSNCEHLVGKNFVPKGAFDGGHKFNFTFRACTPCNSEKAELERHVSSVTLFTSPARGENEDVNAHALHKAERDYHPDKQGVLVKDAGGQHNIRVNQFLSVGFASPPQLNARYVNRLAMHHVQGLFALITSSDPRDPQKTRLLPPDQCWVLGAYHCRDWGNPQLLEVMKRSANWSCRANVSTADGYFRAVMKRDEEWNSGWFWALEWNKSVRVCGAIALAGQRPSLLADLPDTGWRVLKAEKGGVIRMREEVPISEEQDLL